MTGKANHREFAVLCAVPRLSIGPILALNQSNIELIQSNIELNIKVID